MIRRCANIRTFSEKLKQPGNLAGFMQRKQEASSKSEYEESLGRPLTPREKFEQEQLAKEKQEIEEEDHQEDVSFEGRFIYLKLIIFSAIFFSGSYQVHKAIMNR